MTPSGASTIRAWSAWCVGATLALVVFPSPALAADQPSTNASKLLQDPFAALRARLDQKADEILLRASQSAASPEDDAADQEQGSTAPAASSTALQQFALRHWGGQEAGLRRALERVRALRPALEPILKEEGLTPDLLGVVLVESGGHPRAQSPQGARGLWQFMPVTARRYDLRVDFTRDDRLDVTKSTRAAARHLRDLEEQFGSWELALAAYNAGNRTVQRAVRRAGNRNFATLSALRLLPAETRAYVPAVLAAAPLFGGAGLERLELSSGRRGSVVYATAAEPGAAGP